MFRTVFLFIPIISQTDILDSTLQCFHSIKYSKMCVRDMWLANKAQWIKHSTELAAAGCSLSYGLPVPARWASCLFILWCLYQQTSLFHCLYLFVTLSNCHIVNCHIFNLSHTYKSTVNGIKNVSFYWMQKSFFFSVVVYSNRLHLIC